MLVAADGDLRRVAWWLGVSDTELLVRLASAGVDLDVIMAARDLTAVGAK